ncbi:MAG: glycosyltransferase family 39 protein [Candidatus Methylomirabilales bacterium]
MSGQLQRQGEVAVAPNGGAGGAAGARLSETGLALAARLGDRGAIGLGAAWTAVVLASVWRVGILWGGDTPHYADWSVIRPPLYPLFVAAAHRLFPGAGWLVIVWLQTVFGLLAALHLARALRRHLAARPATVLVAYGLLTLPLTPWSLLLGIYASVGNYLLTEALAYGFALLALSFLLRAQGLTRWREYLGALTCIALAVLVRTQMVFLYALVAAALWREHRWGRPRRAVVAAFLAVLCVAAVDIGQRLYHAAVHQHFGRVPLLGSGLLVSALYVSPPDAHRSLADDRPAAVVREARRRLGELRVLAGDRHGTSHSLVSLYNDSYNRILGVVTDTFSAVYGLRSWSDQMFVRYEAFAWTVAPRLIAASGLAYPKLVLLKFLYGFGFREGVFLTLVLLLGRLPVRRDVRTLAWLVAVPLLVNRALLAPVTYMADRYVFYTDILEYVVLAVLLMELAEQRKGGTQAPGR